MQIRIRIMMTTMITVLLQFKLIANSRGAAGEFRHLYREYQDKGFGGFGELVHYK